MNVKETYPKVRTFELTPSDQDGLDKKTHTLRVSLCYDEHELRLYSYYYEYDISIIHKTGDFIKDLILMREHDLVSLSSLENRFILQESIDEVLNGIKETCEELRIDINDARIQKTIERIKSIDEKYFLGNVEKEYNAQFFMEKVDKILQRSPLKEFSDDICTAILVAKDFVKISAKMIVKNLYPILLRELNIDSDEITKEEIFSGLVNGVITLARDYESDCLLVLIGHEHFHITGIEDSRIRAVINTQEHPEDEIVDLIHQTINSAPIKAPHDDTLWRYFKCVITKMQGVS